MAREEIVTFRVPVEVYVDVEGFRVTRVLVADMEAELDEPESEASEIAASVEWPQWEIG